MALFVLIATHSSDQCPTANEKTRKLFGADPAPIMALAQKLGVKPVVGPLVRYPNTGPLLSWKPRRSRLFGTS